MGVDLRVRLGREPALLVVEQHEEDVVAVHQRLMAPTP